MAEIRRLEGESDGFVKSTVIVTAPTYNSQPVDEEQSDDVDCDGDESIQREKGDKDDSLSRKNVKRYYIDELGFYRYLDHNQVQYVCSNINASNLRRALRRNEKKYNLSNGARDGGDSASEGGYQICFRSVRSELGISHFDRTVGYKEWKEGWDEFIRSKLTKQEPVTLNNELKLRVRSGIPHDYRCKVWTALVRMRTRHIRSQTGEDVYENILQRYMIKSQVPDYAHDDQEKDNVNRPSSWKGKLSSYMESPVSLELGIDALTSLPGRPVKPLTKSRSVSQGLIDGPHKFFRQIELDLLRTLPNNRHFEDPNSRGIHRVRRVLRAYACFNPTIGYCQGMNRLAAMALLILPEEEAFWTIVAITQCIMPKDYYLKPWLAQVDCCVLADLLEKKMPKLHKHLVKNDIQLTLFSWFFTIFVDGFRPELMLRIWDCFLLEGDKVLFRFALAILYICQNDLLEMHDFSSMSAHLNRLVSTKRLDTEHLFDSKYISVGHCRSV